MNGRAVRVLVGAALLAASVFAGCGGKTKTVTVPSTTRSTQTVPTVSYERYRARLYAAEVPAGWTRAADQQQHTGYVESKWRDPADPGTSITIDATPKDTTNAGASAQGVRAATRRASSYQELAFEPATVAGHSAWKWTFQVSGQQRVDYFLNACDTGVAVLGSTSPGKFAQLAPVFAHVADSLSISCTSSTPTPPPTPKPSPPSPTASQTCVIKAWYSGSYIHFKCVDESTGTTVDEALGSDSIDFSQETGSARRTARREELVNTLRRQLESKGWRQIGTLSGGEWYQLRFRH